MNNKVDMDESFVKTSNIETFADDEIIIGYCSSNSTTFCFNDISYLIYSMCDSKTPSQIIEHIVELYKLNKEEYGMVRSDVIDVLELFLQHHLIEKSNAN